MLVDCRDSHALIRLVKNSINGEYLQIFPLKKTIQSKHYFQFLSVKKHLISIENISVNKTIHFCFVKSDFVA